MDEDEDEDSSKAKKIKIVVLGLLIHVILLLAVFDVYFASPLDHGMTPIRSTNNPPAKRLVLFVADGLRAEAIFGGEKEDRAPYLTNVLKNQGSWGVAHTRVPTESRPGHVAMLAGIYEDPSAILKGWKSNPVEFDSVINQSTNAWAWGSPDILNMFDKDDSPNVHLHSYGSEMEDFGKTDTGALDTWVFRNVDRFLRNEVSMCSDNCFQYHASGNMFFMHLLGIDTAGHGFKPHSSEYIDNIRLVDEHVRIIVDLFRQIYHDNATAFVFTSDHGMTDWGSHGAGSPHETEAPLVAWGAGVRKNSVRQDLNQIDLAPLLASLIGVNIPTNSLGSLPYKYVDAGKSDLAEMVLSNTLQLLEIFDVKRVSTEASALVMIPFKGLTSDVKVEELKQMQRSGRYDELISECNSVMNLLKEGIDYYHNYYQYPILMSVSLGFLMWILFLGLSIFDYDKVNKKRSKGTNKIFVIVVTILFLLCFKSNFYFTYYIYFTFPVVLYFKYLRSIRFSLPTLSRSTVVSIVFYAAGLELLVYGFFQKVAFSCVMILIGLWIFVSDSMSMHSRGREKLVWLSCCCVLAIFPSLPEMRTSFNVPIYVLGYVGWVVLFTKMFLEDKKIYQRLDKIKVSLRVFTVQFALLNIAAAYVLLLEYDYISSDSNIKYLSWIILTVPILIVPLTSKFIALRLVATFFGFSPFYLLVSPNFEVLFSVFYVALLCSWLLIETKSLRYGDSYKIIFYSKFDNDVGRTKMSTDVFRRSFLFMVFIFLGFFGTGNVASLNSFDPMWVRAFLTVFSPFKMMGLILLKFMVPFIFTCSIFRAINVVGRENILKMFCIILIFSDLMVLQFLYLITNEGSWLDIGTSLSHFIIMETFVTILLILYGFAYWLTSISYKL